MEPAFEEGVWQDDAVLARRRRAAERKRRAREIPEPVGDRGDARLHDLVADVDRLGGRQESSQAIEHRGLIAPRDKIRRHDDVVLAAIVGGGDPHQALGIRIRERSHEHGVDDAEHRRVQTNPEGQREHDDEAETGCANAQAKAVSSVLEEVIEARARTVRARMPRAVVVDRRAV